MSVSQVLRTLSAVSAALLLSGTTALAQGDGPTLRENQSSFSVFGMSVAGPVYLSGSDDRAAAFNAEILPGASELVDVHLAEGIEFLAAGVTRLDEDQLFILNPTDRPVRVYYIHEGACYRNTLGYSTTVAGSTSVGERVMIFPDVSGTYCSGPTYLEPGDFVELGDFDGGTQFEFFIVRDAVNGGTDVFTNQDHLNPDGIQHLAAWLLGDRYVLLGFEDLLNGGDLDYNDVVAVVDLNPDLGQGPLTMLPR